MLVTSSQLSVYDILKASVVQNQILSDGLAAHLSCSFLAGFVASFVTNPVDVVKTRLMNQSKSSDGGTLLDDNLLWLTCFVKVFDTRE